MEKLINFIFKALQVFKQQGLAFFFYPLIETINTSCTKCGCIALWMVEAWVELLIEGWVQNSTPGGSISPVASSAISLRLPHLNLPSPRLKWDKELKNEFCQNMRAGFASPKSKCSTTLQPQEFLLVKPKKKNQYMVALYTLKGTQENDCNIWTITLQLHKHHIRNYWP